MAFAAVMREGIETAAFLLAAFQGDRRHEQRRTRAPCSWAAREAVALGWSIYRGGVRINMARFFRVTGIVLVLVAAGLLASVAAHGARGGHWPQNRLPEARPSTSAGSCGRARC